MGNPETQAALGKRHRTKTKNKQTKNITQTTKRTSPY